MPDHHVEQQVLHLQHGAIAGRAVGIDRLGEEQRRRHPVVPVPVVRRLGIEHLAHLLLADLLVALLPGGIGHELVDQVLAVIHEMQRQIGRHAILLAAILHRRENFVAEDLLRRSGQRDRIHERRVAADGVGRQQVDVEILRTGREIGGELVEEAVAVEEDELDLVRIGRLGVIGLARLAQRRLFGAAGPTEHRHIRKGLRQAEGRESRDAGQNMSELTHERLPLSC